MGEEFTPFLFADPVFARGARRVVVVVVSVLGIRGGNLREHLGVFRTQVPLEVAGICAFQAFLKGFYKTQLEAPRPWSGESLL